MDVNRKNIRVTIVNNEEWLVDLKWFRGASRYNNGCTRYGKKYSLRLFMSRSKEHAIKFKSRIAPLIVCYCLATPHGLAQSDSVKFNPDSSKSISISTFDSLVSNSITLLKTKDLADIPDSGHINIMMCYNTIKFTRTKPGFEFRLANDKYQELENLFIGKDYLNNIKKVYPDWIPTRFFGYYFQKLKMEVYGWPRAYAMFRVPSPGRRSVKFVDSTSGNYFVLDSAHIIVSGFDSNGIVLWKTDPWNDNDLDNYSPDRIWNTHANPSSIIHTYRSLITYFVLGPIDEHSWCTIPHGTRALWIEYGSLFGFLDIRNGKFIFCGQD